VPGLIDAELAAARKCDLRQMTPTHVPDGAAPYSVPFHRRDERMDVGAHEVELVDAVLPRRVDGHFRRGEAEDEPPVSDVDVGEPQNVPEERAIRFRFTAVDYRMGADDHAHLLWPMPCEMSTLSGNIGQIHEHSASRVT
jgi:hypothetical protein